LIQSFLIVCFYFFFTFFSVVSSVLNFIVFLSPLSCLFSPILRLPCLCVLSSVQHRVVFFVVDKSSKSAHNLHHPFKACTVWFLLKLLLLLFYFCLNFSLVTSENYFNIFVYQVPSLRF
jgi:hypothetical protein